MNKVTSVVMVLALTVPEVCGGSNPTSIFNMGSNPYFSTGLYPQDLLRRPGMYLFYCPDYHNRPYWGDIDEPANKPNTTTDYSITGADVVRNGGWFKHSGSIHSTNHNLGFSFRIVDDMMASIEFNNNIDALRNRAEGSFTGTDTNYYPADGTLPFDYSLRHTLDQFSGRALFSMRIGNVPFGVTLEGGMENTMFLKKELSFQKLAKNPDGSFTDSMVSYSMENDEARAFWGWTEPGCSHPFGVRGTQGDSWLQSSYAVGPIYHFNLQSGATFDRLKAGGLFRYKWGHQDQYVWENEEIVDEGVTEQVIVGYDTVISNNFIGRYVKQGQAKISSAAEGRLFGNLKWRGNDRFSLNTFIGLSYLDSTTGSAAADNLEAESSSKEKIHTVGLEFDPNISVKLGDYLNYIDAAILVRYRYSRFNNTYDRWVGGGEMQTYWDTHVYGGWSDVWEDFSYANQNALDLGVDLGAMFPLIRGSANLLSLNLRLFGDVRFTNQKKRYGINEQSGSELTFTTENTRENVMREVMFNTFLMLHYIQGPCHLRLQFTKPVLYSIAMETTITDADGDILDDGNNYPLQKSPLWITQEGLGIALYFSWEFGSPALQQMR